MTLHSTLSDVRRITVTLPTTLLTRLDEHVPARSRGRFIFQAIEERLAIEEQLTVLDETAGAWTDENHPDMKTDEDIDRWLTTLRASWGQAENVANG